MCGIIGIASNKPVSTNIINSLKKLEYRGYDSAGLATLKDNTINEKNPYISKHIIDTIKNDSTYILRYKCNIKTKPIFIQLIIFATTPELCPFIFLPLSAPRYTSTSVPK